jgi:membrane associated rhomboid family serine protease
MMTVFIWRHVQIRPNVVLTIILLNVMIFLLWTSLGILNPVMTSNFLTSWNSLLEGRLWTLVTSFFSHFMLLHLFINMYVLFGFGSMMETTLGSMRFAVFYILAGIAGSLGHNFVSTMILGHPELLALGASGAVSGVIMLFSLMFPHEKILLLGLIPMPAMVGAFLFIGIDIWGVVAQFQGGSLPIGHGAHLGGAVFGMLYYFAFIKVSTFHKISRSSTRKG